MRQTTKHIFKRIEQDIAKDKRDPNMYWEARNLKLVNNGSNLSLKTHDGTRNVVEFESAMFDSSNTLRTFNRVDGLQVILESYNLSLKTMPYSYGNGMIVGTEQAFSDLFIFVVYDNPVETLTVIYKLTEDDVLSIIYFAPLKMNSERAIDIIFNYENEFTAKLYWIDGINQLRHLNINDVNILNLPPESVDMRPNSELKPITEIGLHASSGDTFAKSTVQYAYILYTPGGQTSGLSPLTKPLMVHGDQDDLGSETVAAYVNLRIQNNLLTFSSFKLFRIQYFEATVASGALEPKVFIIADSSIIEDYTHHDTQNVADPEITLTELFNYGAKTLIPRYFNADKNRLLVANYDHKQFSVDYDCRVYPFPKNSSSTTTYDDPTDYNTGISINNINESTFENVPLEFNCVKNNNDKEDVVFCANKNDVAPFAADGFRGYGSTGLNFELKLLYITSDLRDSSGNRIYKQYSDKESFKQRETYRIGIKFFNKAGDETPVHWMTDLYIPTYKYLDSIGNGGIVEDGDFPPIIQLKCEFKNNFAKDRLSNLGVTSYQLVAVERKVSDKTVVAQGYIVPLANRGTETGGLVDSFAPGPYTGLVYNATTGCTFSPDIKCNEDIDLSKKSYAFYSPDIDFNVIDYRNVKVNPVGLAVAVDNRYDTDYGWEKKWYSCYIVHTLNTADFTGYSYNGGCPSPGYNVRPLVRNTDPLKSDFMSRRIVIGKMLTDYKTSQEYINDLASPTSSNNVHTEYIELNDEPIKITKEDNSGTLDGWVLSNRLIKDFHTTSFYTQFYLKSSTFLGITFENEDWSKLTPGSELYSKFYHNTSGLLPSRSGVPIIELVRELTNQYNGYTYEVKQSNEYRSISDVVSINDIAIGYGDVYIQSYDIRRMYFDSDFSEKKFVPEEWVTTILESGVNLKAREDNTIKYGFTTDAITKGTTCTAWNTNGYHFGAGAPYAGIPYDEFFELRGIFKVHAGVTSYAKPYNYNIVTNYKLSVLITEKKHNNELTDSWLQFLDDEELSLDARYGEITGLVKHNSRVMAFQERAVSSLYIAPVAQQTTSTGGGALDIILGEGNPLHSFTYLTTESGTIHNRSIVSSKSTLFFFDYYNQSISVLVTNSDGNELTTALGLQNYFVNYMGYSNLTTDYNNLYLGCTSWYNNSNELIYFTFNSDYDMTISYSIMNQGFVSWHDFTPYGYTNNNSKNYLYKKNSLEVFDRDRVTVFDIDTHSDVIVDQSVTILNSSRDWSIKRYDNIEFSPINKSNYFTGSFNNWEIWNSYQNTGVQQFTPSLKLRKHRSIVPREDGTMNRIRDDHSYFKFTYSEEDVIQLDAMYVSYDAPRISKNNYTENQVK